MPISVGGSNITFNDSTNQGTAYGGAFQGSISVYNSPGTFTTPANTTRVYLIVAGGGGGATNANSNNGAGGSGGGFVGVGVYPVSASTPYPVTVGNGGARNNSGAAGNGNASSFGNILTANGGNGGGPAPATPEAPPGTPGNNGTSPLSQGGAVSSQNAVIQAVALSNTVGQEGNPASPAGNSGAGRVIVYF